MGETLSWRNVPSTSLTCLASGGDSNRAVCSRNCTNNSSLPAITAVAVSAMHAHAAARQTFGCVEAELWLARIKTLFSMLTLLLLAVATLAQRQYPLFKQCDPQWAKDRMGIQGNTVIRA